MTFYLVLLHPKKSSQKTPSCFFLNVWELPQVNILLGLTLST